ncbi:hypothetical protein BLOT_008853 [Blomia tropicalis]|nr:hypothetical protein BLOT_008853 [Blomia tropicalis]
MMNDDSRVMSLLSIDINWSKYQDDRFDRFLTFGNDLKLYVVESVRESSDIFGGIQLSEASYAQVVLAKNDMRHVKSMACNNTLLSSNTDVLFALGYNNGRILLNSFDTSANPAGLVGKEFSAKINRSCNTLDFNQSDNNLLASGFDKARNESSIMIWDIAHTGTLISNSSNYHSQYGGGNPLSGLNKPLYEFAPNELVHSLKWFQNKTIVCGMNNKHIKIFDFRDPNKPKGVITKGVYGIALDPLSNFRFASYSESNIFVWDSRFIESPITTISSDGSNIAKIEWCPTRSNILAALLKDTNSIRLYDYKDYKNLNNEPEPSVLAREISPFEALNTQIISSFSWHPYSESRMVVISSSNIIRDFKVIDRITLNWSPVSEIIWTHGKKILQYIDSRDNLYQNLDDISVKMRRLAVDGYGLSTDKMWQLFEKGEPNYNLWKWMSLRIPPLNNDKPTKSTSIVRDIFSPHNGERLNGIFNVLFGESRTQLLHNEEKITCLNLPGNRQIYTNISRAKALQYCGWSNQTRVNNIEELSSLDLNGSFNSFDKTMPCPRFIKMNDEEGVYSRTAAVMVFNGKIKEAIDCLQRVSDKIGGNERNDNISLNVISLALSAYVTSSMQSSDKNGAKDSLWIQMCSSLKTKLEDPYIKAIFTFLSMKNYEDESYIEIIEDKSLDIADRIAFACMYLSNSALQTFLLKLKKDLFSKADLSATILTGVSEEGLELFSKYIENTCDVQTISLILLWSLPSTICKKPLSKTWIENYKYLLDCWRLWNIRAQFDIKWYSGLNYLEEPKQRIHLACNYCRTPISSYISNDIGVKATMTYQQQMSHHQFNRTSSANASANKYRTISCNNCSKTLPRCSLCLTQLGTPAGTYWRPGLIFSKNDRKLSPFGSWFTWCQNCRHGGHSSHLLGWFAENTVCPVAGCNCKCMSMDANARLV